MNFIREFLNKSNWRKMVLVSLSVAFTSQIYIYFLVSNFRISIAIILFPIFLFWFRELNAVRTILLTSISVYIFRIFIYFIQFHSFKEVAIVYFPEMFFYAFYGIFLWLFNRKNAIYNLNILLINLVFSDYLANILEIFIRQPKELFVLNVHVGLVAVALTRSSIVWILLNFLKYYKMLLIKEQHEERYKKLLCLTSRLKTEMYWMEKNMYHIESTMSQAYTLFEKINSEQQKDDWSKMALNIAKDVHEIKKEYALVVRGVKDITENKLQDKGMYFSDILNILKQSMENELAYGKKNIVLDFNSYNDFYTDKHYYLMSIFRNIIMNAIEAIRDESKNNVISFIHEEKLGKHEFVIKDTGEGIEKENLECIFSPGFSTKINYITGEINRGLGLSIVKDIIEDTLKGKVYIESTIGEGTTFFIYLTKEALE